MRNRLPPFSDSDFANAALVTLRWVGFTVLLALAVHSAMAASDYTMLNAPMPGLANNPNPNSSGYTPAPLPNPDLFRPSANSAEEPQIVGHLLEPDQASPAQQGYSPGSAFSDDLQRRNRGSLTVAPRIDLTVPLY
jgi:hypothetical protein